MSADLIAECARLLRTRYVFPDKAEVAATLLETSLEIGEYDKLDDTALGEKVTAQLYSVCADKHLRLRPLARAAEQRPTRDEMYAMWRERSRRENYGVEAVRRLKGNIGCLDLRSISDPSFGAPAMAAAMLLVSQTRALIIDLRRNGGGSPDGVQFWCTYFFPDTMTHLNSIFDPAQGTKQFWSLPYVPGDRYLDRPVWVLTSDYTFSGGEEFAYNLQTQKRATVVGETTRGGAHPTEPIAVSTTMEFTVPIARSINPITGTNWEGVGVVPDVAMPAAEAFDFVYRLALEHVCDNDQSEAAVAEAQTALDGLGQGNSLNEQGNALNGTGNAQDI